MLDDQRSGVLFGNEEFLIDAFVGPTLDGPGSVWGGGTLILRHNFALGHRPIVVPYFQIGAGLVASDASSDERQFAVGLPVEFNLQSSAGVSRASGRLALNLTTAISPTPVSRGATAATT